MEILLLKSLERNVAMNRNFTQPLVVLAVIFLLLGILSVSSVVLFNPSLALRVTLDIVAVLCLIIVFLILIRIGFFRRR